MAVQHSYFHNLPVEVLDMVFQSLRRLPHCLRSLAQTCRRVSDLIIPMLYSSIYLRTPDSCKQLAATVIRNPRLASLLRELQVHYHDARNDENHDAVLDVLLEVENLEILSLRSVPLYQVLEESSHKLLSMFVPKKSIDVECHTQYIGHRLRSLYLGAERKHCHQDWWVLGPNEIVFYMEKLQKLHIQGAKIGRLHPKTFSARMPSKKTALKELTFLNCDISSHTVRQILAFPEALTNFTIKGASLTPTIAAECRLSIRNCILELERSTSTGLEYLDLDIWNAETSSDFDCLDKLKHLTISPQAIQGYAMERDLRFTGRSLPVSLETLMLKDFNKEGLPVELLLTKVRDGLLPSLRTITYGTFYDEEDNEGGENDWKNEVKAFHKLGVELSIARYQDPSAMPENENWPCKCWIYQHAASAW